MYNISNVTGEAEILKAGPAVIYGFQTINASVGGVTVCFSDSAVAATTGAVHYYRACPTRGRVSDGLSVEFYWPLRFTNGARAKVCDWTSGCSTYVRWG